MKLIVQRAVLIFCVTTLFIGCDQQMTQPIKDVIPPAPTNIEMARKAMERVNQRRTTTQQKAEAAGDFTTILFESETILTEELSFRKGFWVELVDIYRDEHANDDAVREGFDKLQAAFAKKLKEDTLGMFYFEYIRTFDPLIVEYLRLSYVYPNQSEETLLERFRQSVRDEKVSITFPQSF